MEEVDINRRRTNVNEDYELVTLPRGLMLLNRHDPTLLRCLLDTEREINLLMQFCQGNVLEVGANIGGHTINFARKATNVYAIEPHPRAFQNLCANLLLNGIENVKPLELAMGNVDGYTYMVPQNPHEYNVLMGNRVSNDGTQPVKMLKVDTLALSPLHFMLIDVEGYELEVLKGARETLIREDLIIYVEIHIKGLIDKIGDYLDELGYTGRGYILNFYISDLDLRTWGYIYWKKNNPRVIGGEQA